MLISQFFLLIIYFWPPTNILPQKPRFTLPTLKPGMQCTQNDLEIDADHPSNYRESLPQHLQDHVLENWIPAVSHPYFYPFLFTPTHLRGLHAFTGNFQD